MKLGPVIVEVILALLGVHVHDVTEQPASIPTERGDTVVSDASEGRQTEPG
jgi:hypothetical protein